MKAITILQPWASLIACGAKKIETRSWPTKYRGQIAIHAGAKGIDIRDLSGQMIVAAQQLLGISNFDKLPHGCVIAIADLVDCIKMVSDGTVEYRKGKAPLLMTKLENGATLTGQEKLFGHYAPGRYAWILDNVRPIEPVPAKGMQRLWNWDGEYKLVDGEKR